MLQEMRAQAGKETPKLEQSPTGLGIMNKPAQRTNQRVEATGPSAFIKEVSDFMSELNSMKQEIKTKNAAPTVTPGQSGVTKVKEEKLGVAQSKELPIKRGETKNVENPKFEFKSIPKDIEQDTDFLEAVDKLATKLETSPEVILSLIEFETAGTFDPSVVNAAGSGATGLIQFMPKTAEGLGTTVGALAEMNRAEQMVYVDKYFSQFGDKLKGASAEELYTAILYPASLGKSPETVLFKKGTKAYAQNSGFDKNQDGVITKGEATRTALMKRRSQA